MKPRALPSSDREAILRRAIIRAIPDYYSWPEIERERYRLNLPQKQDFLIRRALLSSLLGIEVSTAAQLDDVMKGFDDECYLLLNSTLLPFQGIGENDFLLNEWLADGVSLLDFETLGDYARDDHEFQDEARKKEDPAYEIRPYQGDLHPCWARLNIDGEFHYATLVSLAKHLVDTLDETGSEQIEALIPQRYDEYLSARHERVLDQFDEEAMQQIYIQRETQGLEAHIRFIFSDKSALDAVRFRQFFSDYQRIAGDITELAVVIAQEKQAAVEFLQAQYRDIKKNFDPSVVPLRKKRKIVLADGALDDLS